MSEPYPIGNFGHFPYGQQVDFGMGAQPVPAQMMGVPHPQMQMAAYDQQYGDMSMMQGGMPGGYGGMAPGVGYPPMRGEGGYMDNGGPRRGRGGGKGPDKSRNSNLPSVTDPDGLRDDTVFVTGLPQNIDHESMKSEFGQIGKVKMNATTKMPMIWIFKEKGIPKGDALVTFEDLNCVKNCIDHFKTNDFQGYKISVRQATNCERPVIIPPGGGRDSRNMYEPRGAPMMRGRGRGNMVRPNMGMMGYGGGAPGGYGGQGGQGDMDGSRNGDWKCESCDNVNFAWRKACNRCKGPKAEDGMDKPAMKMPPMGRGGMAPVRGGPMMGARGGYGRGGPVPPGNMYMMGAPMGRGGAGGPLRGGPGGARQRPAPY